MTKYSLEFKLKVVEAYLGGSGGYRYLAKQFNVKSKSQIHHWVNRYSEKGVDGLRSSPKNKTYTVQFKLDAIKLYQTSEFSYRELANTLGIPTPALIATWVYKFNEYGVDGLANTKGRPPNMPKKKG